MKISVNTIRNLSQRYGCSDDIAAIGVDALVNKIGAQLGAVDEVTRIGEKYQGIVIAKVVSCQKHPDADKLKVCMIDAGQDSDIQVVCGAPNVREGMTVAWLPPGATVPETVGKEPFVLEARELRGVVSNGMLASPKELALGDSHQGLLEIDGDYKTGTDFAEAFGLKNDVLFDIENKMFTHRPDCFGLLGIARELAGIQQMPFKSPAWYTPQPELPGVETEELKLEIKNELPDLVPRFTAIAMSSIRIGPSPVWLQVELAKIGQKSVNNIVDYTNWFMLLTGQPLHAYDYDKVKALSQSDATIVIRKPDKGEKIKLLNGKEVEPRSEAIMIATDKQLIGIGGVMGGAETEVDQSTKNIILECANFDMYSVRRTSMEHGLFTEAVTRFTKGQSPLQNLAVLSKTVNEIRQSAGGKVASQLVDDKHLDETKTMGGSVIAQPVQVTSAFINARLGLSLTDEEIINILNNVEFASHTKLEELCIQAPFWRTDIEIREDIVEEVGRLYGYDKLPVELPSRVIEPTTRDALFDLKGEVRQRLSKAGANEVLTYSFVPGDLLDKTGQDKSKAFQIANALSPDLQYYRLSLMPSLLDKVHPNIKAGYDKFALFELGKTHSLDQVDKDGLPGEFEFTALVVTAADKLKTTGAAYFHAVSYLEALTNTELVFKPISEEMKGYPVVQPYDQARSALVSIKDGDFLGIIGEFRPGVLRSLKLPKYTAGFEIDTRVLESSFQAGPSYVPISRFPAVKQDITLKAPADLSFENLHDLVNKQLGVHAPENSHIQLSPIDIYQKDDSHKQTTFRISITASDRTLTDKEVSAVLDKIAESANSEYGTERV